MELVYIASQHTNNLRAYQMEGELAAGNIRQNINWQAEVPTTFSLL
jgi:hypothetical protein